MPEKNVLKQHMLRRGIERRLATIRRVITHIEDEDLRAEVETRLTALRQKIEEIK